MSITKLIHSLRVPASETQMGLGLGIAAAALGLMLWAVVWQSNVISYQRDLIQWMWTARSGG